MQYSTFKVVKWLTLNVGYQPDVLIEKLMDHKILLVATDIIT